MYLSNVPSDLYLVLYTHLVPITLRFGGRFVCCCARTAGVSRNGRTRRKEWGECCPLCCSLGKCLEEKTQKENLQRTAGDFTDDLLKVGDAANRAGTATSERLEQRQTFAAVSPGAEQPLDNEESGPWGQQTAGEEG